jgi:hypothetical protein
MAMSGCCHAMLVMCGIDSRCEQPRHTAGAVVTQEAIEDDWHFAPLGSMYHTQTHMKLVRTNPSLRKLPILAAHRLYSTSRRKTQTFVE